MNSSPSCTGRCTNIDLDNSLPPIVSLIKQGSKVVKDMHDILTSLDNHIQSRCGGEEDMNLLIW
jgi:hypothetical protein